jgi:geranylgeranyl reductase family protein
VIPDDATTPENRSAEPENSRKRPPARRAAARADEAGTAPGGAPKRAPRAPKTAKKPTGPGDATESTASVASTEPTGPTEPSGAPARRTGAAARRSRPARGKRGHKDGHEHDVVVVGAGPSGSSCAYWLADAGWDVAVVEKKQFPREKTCGDGLTPRAVRQLADMGLEDSLAGSHRYIGLRSCGWGLVLEMPWPDHPSFPPYGYTITRHDLDGIVAERAAKAGATVHQHTEALAPVLADVDSGPGGVPRGGDGSLPACAGVTVRDLDSGVTHDVRGRYLVVADGSNSRVGRALGTSRRRGYPLGMALRGYYRSPRHDDPYIESHLDIRDAKGEVVPGYGWIFPLGDGRVNVGVGLLSAEQRWKGVNTSRLMDAFVAGAPKSWGLSEETSCGPPTGGKLPMSFAVDPQTGPNTVVVGDAAGAINPFNGEGIAYAYETGRLAAASVSEALAGDGPAALARHAERLEAAYGDYYRVGRAFVRLISNPAAMHWCVAVGMRSEVFMKELMRIMANLMRPGSPGGAEIGYDALVRIAELMPERVASLLR